MSEKYANKENLERFWSNAKEYIGNERQEIEDQLYNWQKTEKAPAVQCEPVPNSELHPVVNFMFKETLPEGDKSPSNPSTITGVSNAQLVYHNENLNNDVTAFYSRRATRSADGWITGEVPAGVDDTAAWSCTFSEQLDVTKHYCAIVEIDEISNCYGIKFSDSTSNNVAQLANASYITPMAVGMYKVPLYINKTIAQGATNLIRVVFISANSNVASKPNVNAISKIKYRITVLAKDESEVDLSTFKYIKPEKISVTAQFGNTYYGGFLDFTTGQMTVTQKAVVLDGTEAWFESIYSQQDQFTWFQLNTLWKRSANTESLACTHFTVNKTFNIANGFWQWANVKPFFISRPGNVTVEEFKAWLASEYSAGHPVIFTSELYEPEIVQLTAYDVKSFSYSNDNSRHVETFYTNVDSIQVEYQKYIGIDSTLDSDSVNAIQNKVVNSALNTKVSLTGDETIGGTKTFSNAINGSITGDAGTVAGHIVSKDVPVNAAFTDTTYEPATQSTAGLMSASDKTKLDAVGSVFTFKGSVIDDIYLPASDNVNGDAYLAEDTSHVHVYDGTNFVDIGTWAGIPSATDAQIDALFED